MTHRWLAGAIASGFLVAGMSYSVAAQAPTVQPSKGQSAEQMQRDVGECQAAAKTSSGYDPAAPPPPKSDERHVGGRVRGGAAGAAVGAVGAEARGRDHDAWDEADDDRKQDYRREEAKDAAAVGAAVGAVGQRHGRRKDRRKNRKDEKEQASAADLYASSYKTCLQGRGYVVTP